MRGSLGRACPVTKTIGKPCAGNRHARFERGSCPFTDEAPSQRVKGLDLPMSRRGFAILFTLLGVAFFISIVGFALLYLVFGREPAVPSNATLVLRCLLYTSPSPRD